MRHLHLHQLPFPYQTERGNHQLLSSNIPSDPSQLFSLFLDYSYLDEEPDFFHQVCSILHLHIINPDDFVYLSQWHQILYF